MRVVQLLTQSVGGPPDHAVDVAVGLVERGVESHVIGPVCPRTEEARARGVTWHPLEMVHKTDLRGGLAVLRRLRSLHPDIVHLQDRRAGWLGRGLSRLLGGAGIVYTLHGVADGLSDLVAGNALVGTRRRRDRWYYLTGERLVTRWGQARVVVPSAAVGRFAIEHVGLAPGIVDVVPNGVDADRFVPARELADPADAPPTALWLGVLADVKRIELLLDAVALVPDLRVLVAGDGPLWDEVTRRAAAPALAGRVTLLGRVTDPAPLFARAHFFTLTSAAENCPLAMLQAMACGLPVVATAVGGIPEVVREGREGLLCPADDTRAVAGALAALSADPALRATMGAAARERILAGYTLDHCIDGLLASYAKARACRP